MSLYLIVKAVLSKKYPCRKEPHVATYSFYQLGEYILRETNDSMPIWRLSNLVYLTEMYHLSTLGRQLLGAEHRPRIGRKKGVNIPFTVMSDIVSKGYLCCDKPELDADAAVSVQWVLTHFSTLKSPEMEDMLDSSWDLLGFTSRRLSDEEIKAHYAKVRDRRFRLGNKEEPTHTEKEEPDWQFNDDERLAYLQRTSGDDNLLFEAGLASDWLERYKRGDRDLFYAGVYDVCRGDLVGETFHFQTLAEAMQKAVDLYHIRPLDLDWQEVPAGYSVAEFDAYLLAVHNENGAVSVLQAGQCIAERTYPNLMPDELQSKAGDLLRKVIAEQLTQ